MVRSAVQWYHTAGSANMPKEATGSVGARFYEAFAVWLHSRELHAYPGTQAESDLIWQLVSMEWSRYGKFDIW